MRCERKGSPGRSRNWPRTVLCILAIGWGASASAEPEWRSASGGLGDDGESAIEVRTLEAQTLEGTSAQRLVYRFPQVLVSAWSDGSSDVHMPSAVHNAPAGAPVLPSVSARVAIPQGHELVSVDVVPGSMKVQAIRAPVRHAHAPYRLDVDAEPAPSDRNEEIYSADARYPSRVSSGVAVHRQRGVEFVDLVLHPVQVNPVTGLLYVHSELAVLLETAPVAARAVRTVDVPRLRSDRDRDFVADRVDNPAIVAAYVAEDVAPSPVPAAARGGDTAVSGFSAEDLPASAASDYKHVIITSLSLCYSFLSPDFDDLVDLRNAQGLSSTIVTVEDIVDAYPGVDAPASIRLFIRDAFDKWGTEYVLLGGDEYEVPMRSLRAAVGTANEDIPSDLYYACLDGTFDSNGDGIYGEALDGTDRNDGRPGGDVDLYAEVFVGRAPVGGSSDLARWVQKLLDYEARRADGSGPFLRGGLLVSEDMGLSLATQFAATMMEEIRTGTSEHDYRTEGFEAGGIVTNSETRYDNVLVAVTGSDMATLINTERFSFFNHAGPPSRDQMMALNSGNVSLLNNDDTGFLYSQAGYAASSDPDFGQFGADSIVQDLLSGTAGGFFGGQFNTSASWATFGTTDSPVQRFNRWFWHAFFGESLPSLGHLNRVSHERNAPRINDDAMRWSYYSHNLFCDPAQWLYGNGESLILDREGYRSGAQATVELRWPLVSPTQLVAVVDFTLTNTAGVVISTNIVCNRAGGVSGVGRFVSDPVMLSPLGAAHDQMLIATWTDPADTNRMLLDEAMIDDVPPVISNLVAGEASDASLTVNFDTDEDCISVARAGESLPPPVGWSAATQSTFQAAHEIRIAGLDEFTAYYISVWAEDKAGNRSYAPANPFSVVPSEYLLGTTGGREVVAQFDWEQGTAGWVASNINGEACWDYGIETVFGPMNASRGWGTFLNARYTNGVNGVLTSPPFEVRGSPLVVFSHWYDIQYSLGFNYVNSPAPFGDYGQIEVLAGGVWQDVTTYANINDGFNRIFGASNAYHQARLALPDRFANQTLQIRFRFVSDEQTFEIGNPAGWYIDDLSVSDVPSLGLGLSRIEVSDSGGTTVGDGDGFAEPGETVTLGLYVFNQGTNTISGLSGTFVVSVAGLSSNVASLVGGSPAVVSYDPVDPGEEMPSDQTFDLQLASGIAPNAVVTILQTLTDSEGRIYEAQRSVPIGVFVNISGSVETLIGGTPIAGADVVASGGGETLSTVTAGDGSFTLLGASSNGIYTVTAQKPGSYSVSNVVLIAPATGVVFALGAAEVHIDPTSVALSTVAGGSDSAQLCVSNAATASAPLGFELEEIEYLDGSGWLSVIPAGEVVLDPAQSAKFTVNASAIGVLSGTYNAILHFATTDPDDLTIEVPVAFTVSENALLNFLGFVISDDTDLDRFLEAGETADMSILLQNTNGLSDAVGIEGVLTPLTNVVTVTGSSNLFWSYIPPFGSAGSDDSVNLALDPGVPPGAVLPFRLDVTHATGSNVFFFSMTHYVYHSITGSVRYTALPPPELPEGAVLTNGVIGATVTAVDSNGNRYVSFPTTYIYVFPYPGLDNLVSWGNYSLEGVPEGNTWIRADPRPGFSSYNPYVAFAGSNWLVNSSPHPVNLGAFDYGYSNTPHVLVYDISVSDIPYGDGDGFIDPGERLEVLATLYNDGLETVLGSTGVLAVADMGLGVGPYMSVVSNTSGEGVTLLNSDLFVLPTSLDEPFVVDVNSSAMPGDVQRFWLDVSEEAPEGKPARLWPFDFALTVDPRYEVAGTVSFANPADNTASNLAQVRITVEHPDGARTIVPQLDGTYAVPLLPGGETVEVSAGDVFGFVVSNAMNQIGGTYTIAPLVSDTNGFDFVYDRSTLRLTPAHIDATLPEGTSATNTVTVHNDSLTAGLVDLSVRYRRTNYDVLDPAVALAREIAENAAAAKALPDDAFVEDEIEVRFADGTGWMEREAILAANGLRAIFHFKLIPACLATPIAAAKGVELSARQVADAVAQDPRILYAEASVRMSMEQLTPNDGRFDEMWGLQNLRQTGGSLGADIGATDAWMMSTGSTEIIVGVADTGIDYTHPDLADNIWENPLEGPGDLNRDGFPGTEGMDDDLDAARNLYAYDIGTATTKGPETVPVTFDPSMWVDQDSNLIPDFFEVDDDDNGVPDVFDDNNFNGTPDLLESAPFNDTDTNGVPDIFEDLDGNSVPDIFEDEDGDGIVNETGIDYRDEDVMTADYDQDGEPLLRQTIALMPWPGPTYFRALNETWDEEGRLVAAGDDDENGYADDLRGWNFANWTGDISDLEGHGTHVSGTIGAVGDNGIGVVGVNWRVKLMGLRLVDDFGVFTSSARIAKAIEYGLYQGAKVSNHSWGGPGGSGVLSEIIGRAGREFNHLVVVAAGNAGNDVDKTRAYPAYYSVVRDNVITVAAADHDDQLAPFSNWGVDSVQIAAPGVDVLSTMPRTFGRLSGTSMASPHVAGAAALLWSRDPDALFESVKNALLMGVRKDPRLDGWVGSGGHLNVYRSMQLMGIDWLVPETNQVSVAAGASTNLSVFLNPERALGAGLYGATLVASATNLGSAATTVDLTVLEQPVAVTGTVTVVADTDGDGWAEPGETVDFTVTIQNGGIGNFIGLQGELTPITTGVTVVVSNAAWDVLFAKSSGTSLTAYRVTIPAGAPAVTLFDLALQAPGAIDQSLQLALPTLARQSVSGSVVDSASAGVSNAIVEYFGAAFGSTLTDTSGLFVVHGLLPGDYTFRAIPSGHARSAQVDTTVAGSDVALANIPVLMPDLQLSSTGVTEQLSFLDQTNNSLIVSNLATDVYEFRVEISPLRRIGLFSDRETLGPLVAPLQKMGFSVDHHTNNFETVHVIDAETGAESIEQQVRLTWDVVNLLQYDFVIMDLVASDGQVNRLLSDNENDAMEAYVARGGKLLVTGPNPLTGPDNVELAALMGLAVTGRTDTIEMSAEPLAAWSGRFLNLDAGDHVPLVPRDVYPYLDRAPADSATVLFDAGTANKLTVSRNALDGAAFFWSYQVSDGDWGHEGVWQDVLRDILLDEFFEDVATRTDMPWIRVTPNTGSVANASAALDIAFNPDLGTAPGSYEAVVALIGGDAGEEVCGIPVRLTVLPLTLRAFTTGQVVDWRGDPLPGGGGPESALYQVIFAGTNGTIDPPGLLDGAPSADDEILAEFHTGESFGRFGGGLDVTPEMGQFNRDFTYGFPAGQSNALIYVRAWNGVSVASSLAYGDSAVIHEMQYTADEERDFGSWTVSNAVNFIRDSNGDSIPDGWLIRFRPDLDPHGERQILSNTATQCDVLVVPKNISADPAPQPYRAFLSEPSGRFIYTLDRANNRISITDTNSPATETFFGSAGTNSGQFATPEGLAWDPRPGEYRFAVADTSNHRVQIFTYDPLTGAISFERAIGSYGTAPGEFDRPSGVAFDGIGRLFVADTLNNRVQSFVVSSGTYFGQFFGSGAHVLSAPRGLCVDNDLDGGVWVADTGNDRVALYTAGGIFKRGFGSSGMGTNQFETPVDIQVWRVASTKRLCIVDKSNGRIRVTQNDGTPVMSVGSSGVGVGQLSLPNGVFPIDDSDKLLVSDTGNRRLLWFCLQLDVDQDGMEDLWEDLNGLDSTTDDAYLDKDGDGVFNLAEYILGTDPCDSDSNGSGASDFWALANGLDPAATNVFYDPPAVTSLTVNVPLVSAGETTTVTVVYDQPIASNSIVKTTLTGGALGTFAMLRQSDTVFTYDYVASLTDGGQVSAGVNGALSTNMPTQFTQDPVTFNTSNLFSIVASITSITAVPGTAAAGDNVTITVNFSAPVTDNTPKLALGGSAALAPTVMVKDNVAQYSYVFNVPGSAPAGDVSASVQDAMDALAAVAIDTSTNLVAFSIFYADFSISSFDGNRILKWPAPVGAKYEIETNSTVSATGWGVLDTITSDADPECYTNAASQTLFYRVKRVDP